MTKLKTINIKGKEYVEVNERLIFFRKNYKNHSLKDSILPYLDGMTPFKINSESMWEDDIIFVRK